MTDKRRKTKDEYRAEAGVELPTAGEDEGQRQNADPSQSQDQEQAEAEPQTEGVPQGDFEAVSAQDRQEVNDLFRLVHSEGYMTAGTYEVTSDGENTLVSLQVMLPSSGGLPAEPDGES